MKLTLRILLPILSLLCFAGSVHAAGGTCPSQANMDGNNPKGGFAAPTNCYYIDFVSGNDSNTGTDKTQPLKHSVGMAGCTGTCATMSVGGGTGIIFKGGVTWDWTIWPWQPFKGGSGGTDKYGGCTGSGCIYYGVDKSWFTGGSWTRPVFSGGDWSNPGTNTTCYYDTHSHGNPNFGLDLAYRKYIIVDNLEFTGMCNTTGSGGKIYYVFASSGSGGGSYTIENCFFHRATFPASAPPTSGDYWAAVGVWENTTHYIYNVVDGYDSGPTTSYSNASTGYSGEGIYQGSVYAEYNVFANLPESLDVTPNPTIQSNYFLNGSAKSVTSSVHNHIANDNGCFHTQTYWHDNVIDTTVGGQGHQPAGSCTFFDFNNVWTNDGISQAGGRMWNFAPASSQWYIFNNTAECGLDAGPPNGFCGPFNQAIFAMYNMHFVTSSGAISCQSYPGPPVVPTCASWTTTAGTLTNPTFTSIPGSPSDILIQTKATANGQGYSYAQTYQFSPTSPSGSTVGTGVNMQSVCNLITDSDAQAACKKDTTYAVGYNQTNHTVIVGTRTQNTRPVAGAWDVGAYQQSGGSPQAAAPTFNPIAGAYIGTQSVVLSTTTPGAAICYTTDGSTPTANGAGICTHGSTYSGAVVVGINLTINAIASASGYTDSVMSSAAYSITSPPANTVAPPGILSITSVFNQGIFTPLFPFEPPANLE